MSGQFLRDLFGRTVSNGWGEPYVGPAWQIPPGNTQTSVPFTDGQGHMWYDHTTANAATPQIQVVGALPRAGSLQFKVQHQSVALLGAGFILDYGSAWRFHAVFSPLGNGTFFALLQTGGVAYPGLPYDNTGQPNSVIQHTIAFDTWYNVKIAWDETTVTGKMWAVGTTEPGWQIGFGDHGQATDQTDMTISMGHNSATDIKADFDDFLLLAVSCGVDGGLVDTLTINSGTGNSAYTSSGQMDFTDVRIRAQVLTDAASPTSTRKIHLGGDTAAFADFAELSVATDGSVALDTNATGDTASTAVDLSQPFYMRLHIDGTNATGRIWQAADPEPTMWDVTAAFTAVSFYEDAYVGITDVSPPTETFSVDVTTADICSLETPSPCGCVPFVADEACNCFEKDQFGRTVVNGLGTADWGGLWTIAGGVSHSLYQVTPGQATIDNSGSFGSVTDATMGLSQATLLGDYTVTFKTDVDSTDVPDPGFLEDEAFAPIRIILDPTFGLMDPITVAVNAGKTWVISPPTNDVLTLVYPTDAVGGSTYMETPYSVVKNTSTTIVIHVAENEVTVSVDGVLMLTAGSDLYMPITAPSTSGIRIQTTSAYTSSSFPGGSSSFDPNTTTLTLVRWCPIAVGPCEPTANQPVLSEVVGTGDGVTTVFTTRHPYNPVTLEVDVDGAGRVAVPVDWQAGTFSITPAPGAGTVITVSYLSGTGAVGAPPSVPPHDPATGGSFSPPTITNDVTITGSTISGVQAIIDGAPDGTQFTFPADHHYSGSLGIVLTGRTNLEFIGNGAVLDISGTSGATNTSAFKIEANCQDIAIRDFYMHGQNSDGLFHSGTESQMGVAIYDGHRIEIDRLRVDHIFGDGAFLASKETAPYRQSSDIWIHDSSFDYVGRMGVVPKGVDNLVFRFNTLDHLSLIVFDLEQDYDWEYVDICILSDNVIGSWSLSDYQTNWFLAGAYSIGNPSLLAGISNLTVERNTVGAPAVNSNNPSGKGGLATILDKTIRTQNIVIRDNTTSSSGSGPVMHFAHCDGITVTGNTQPLSSGSLTTVSDSTSVVTSPNP